VVSECRSALRTLHSASSSLYSSLGFLMAGTEITASWPSRMKRQHRYPPVGRCIYHDGGDWVGRLTLEHVIPEGLGGKLELPDATCDACAKITSAMEGQNAGRLFRPIRRQLNFPSKGRGKARREARRQEQFVVRIDGKKRYIPTAEYPGLLLSFVFPLPTALLGIQPDYRSFAGGVSLATLPGFGERLNALRTKYGQNVEFPNFGSAELVGRLLAKIGHAYAVAELGYGSFRPYLLGIIRDHDPMLMHHVVGSAVGELPAGDDLHEIAILPPGQIGDPKLVVVRVRLFANVQGMPAHYVIAGERL
jgi:hypothetical protein